MKIRFSGSKQITLQDILINSRVLFFLFPNDSPFEQNNFACQIGAEKLLLKHKIAHIGPSSSQLWRSTYTGNRSKSELIGKATYGIHIFPPTLCIFWEITNKTYELQVETVVL